MRLREWLLLVLLSILWGGTFFAVVVALKEVPPLTLVLVRCTIAALLLAPCVLAMGLKMPTSWGTWRDFAVMSILNNVIPFSLIVYAQTVVPSGVASVLNATTPLFTLLIAWWLGGDALPRNKMVGIAVGLLGVIVLIGPAALTGTSANTIGMAAIICATLSYGFSGLWGRRLKAIPPLVIALGQLTCSTLILMPIAGLFDRFWTLSWPSAPVLWSVLALSVLSTALAYIIFFEIMAKAGSSNVMLVTLLIPFTSIALGTTLLGETLTLQQIIGGLIIGFGLLVIDGRLFGASQAQAQPATEVK
jgi:drug/metabolite transporter (DMT)-like permease